MSSIKSVWSGPSEKAKIVVLFVLLFIVTWFLCTREVDGITVE